MTRRFIKIAFLLSAMTIAIMPAAELRAQDTSKANALIDDVTRATRAKLIQARLANFGDMDDQLSLKILDSLIADDADFKRFLVDDAYAAKILSYSDELKQYIQSYLSGTLTTRQYEQLNELLIMLYPNTFNMLPGLAS